MRHAVATALVAGFCLLTLANVAGSHESTVEVLSQSRDSVVLRFEFTPDPGGEASPSSGEPSPVEHMLSAADARPVGGAPPLSVAYARPPGRERRGERRWSVRSAHAGPFSTLVRVPDTGAISIDVSDLRIVGRDGSEVAYSRLDAASVLEVSAPAVLRDLRVVRVTFRPDALALPPGHQARAVTAALRTSAGPGLNEKKSRHRFPSPAFARLYETTVINFEPERTAHGVLEGAGRSLVGSRYVIIVDATMATYADSLVAWKEEKGLLPVVLPPPSGIAWTRMGLRDTLIHAYNNWDVPPEFVLILGDTEVVPTGAGHVRSDNYYATLDGEDYLLDVFVGRLPAETELESRAMFAKTLVYDRPWLVDATDWPRSGSLLLREDGDASDEIYYANSRLAHGLMDAAGFAPVDTLYLRYGDNNVTSSMVIASLSEGKGLVNFRGVSSAYWAPPFGVWPGDIHCGNEPSIVMSATCLSGNYYDDDAIGEAFVRVGDEYELKGAAAFFGTSTFGAGLDLSIKRGYLDDGFFLGAFGPGRTLGEACASAKANLYTHLDDRDEYEGWNLLGDPELSIWTSDLSTLTVDYDDIIPSSCDSFEVGVTAGGAPVEGAVVTLNGMPESFAWGVTDAEGIAVITPSFVSASTPRLTAVAKNARPYGGDVRVLASGPYVSVEAESVEDDSGGNGDGFVSPGESVLLEVELVNLGDALAQSVVAELSSPDEHVTITDGVVSYGDIVSDDASWGQGPFALSVSSDWRGGYHIPLALSVSYGDSLKIYELPRLETVTGDLTLEGLSSDDDAPGGNGNGELEPGETVAIEVLLSNGAQTGLERITGVLESRSEGVAVVAAESSFPDASQGESSCNEGTPYVISVAPDAPPGSAKLFLRIDAEATDYAYAETLALSLSVEELPPLHPTGPDNHGYYAYDSSDSIYTAAPRFEWTELAPPGPGALVQAITDSDNETVTLDLPFLVRYYGLNRSVISICSNGFAMLKTANDDSPANAGIPTIGGPGSLVAPFWDDLDPSLGGDVYAWHDTTEQRYIIEYDEVRHKDSEDLEDTETFQLIIRDREYHPTPTGDTEILVQYLDVTDPGGCTVGIEHPYETTGIEYSLDGTAGSFAAPLTAGLAVLFTTAEPETLRFPWLLLSEVALDDSEGGDGDGVPAPGETLNLVIELANAGASAATGLELRLSSDSEDVAVLQGSAAVADIGVGGSAMNDGAPFSFTVSEDPGAADFTLRVAFGDDANTRQGAMRIDLPTGRPDPVGPSLLLHPGRPNPFSAGTSFSMNIPRDGRVTVKVYDVAGRLVKTIDDGRRAAGVREAHWDGTNTDGRPVASGVYFVRLTSEGEESTRKVVLLR